jgi:isocitrate dehydrogenase
MIPMPQFTYLKPPTSGTAIAKEHDEIVVPDVPIVPFIEGNRTGANSGDDLARQMEGATELKTSQFADAIIGNR